VQLDSLLHDTKCDTMRASMQPCDHFTRAHIWQINDAVGLDSYFAVFEMLSTSSYKPGWHGYGDTSKTVVKLRNTSHVNVVHKVVPCHYCCRLYTSIEDHHFK